MRTKRTSSSTPVTCCFAQLRRSMRHAPRFTGRASTGVVRSSPRPPARVSAKITFRTAQKRARAAVVTHRHLPLQPASRRPCRLSFVRDDSAFATDGSGRSVYPRVLGRLQFWVSTTRRTVESSASSQGRHFVQSARCWRCGLHSGGNIGERQVVAYSGQVGHRFRNESGHRFRAQSGH